MGIRTFIWGAFFFSSCIAAFWNPIWGIIGYIGHYTVGPEQQWWAAPVNRLALRYSFLLAACTAIGILLTRMNVTFRGGWLHSQQKLILAFLAMVWISTLISPETIGRYGSTDHPSVKLTKVVIFTFMLCHVASNLKDLNRVIVMIMIGALVLGEKAYTMPRSAFSGGRLERVGGADFSESNFLGAFLVGVLPIIGVEYLRAARYMKLLPLVTGVLVTNTLVLVRSRGAFLGLAMTAIVAVVYSPKELRKTIYLGLLVAAAGGYYLTDEQFFGRMSTIAADESERDESANQRLETWQAGIRMILDNPLGVGTGNWYQVIGKYDAKYVYRDSHSTYIKLFAEHGLIGGGVFLCIVFNAFLTLHRVRRRSEQLPAELLREFQYLSLGFTLGLAGFLLCCFLITLLYMEALWWFLALPVCLERSLDQAEQEWLEAHPEEDDELLEVDESDPLESPPELIR